MNSFLVLFLVMCSRILLVLIARMPYSCPSLIFSSIPSFIGFSSIFLRIPMTHYSQGLGGLIYTIVLRSKPDDEMNMDFIFQQGWLRELDSRRKKAVLRSIAGYQPSSNNIKINEFRSFLLFRDSMFARSFTQS